MPEGPSVKRFQLRCCPFVGQVVTDVGGSTKQIKADDLKTLTLWHTEVHGKNLFLAFRTTCTGEGKLAKIPECKLSSQETTEARENSFLSLREADAVNTSNAQCLQQEGPEDDLPSLMDEDMQHPCIWLHFHFGLYGSIRVNEFARANQANKRGDWKDPVPRLVLHFDGGGFLVFYNCRIRMCSSPTAEPATDIMNAEFDRGRALEALCKATPVSYTLLDQRYFSGLGNIIKNEALYLARIHPLSLGSLLAPSELASLLDCVVQFSMEWLQRKKQEQRLHFQVYMKDRCPEGHEVIKGTFGPPDGLKRLTWWCPQCQPQVPSEPAEMSPSQSN